MSSRLVTLLGSTSFKKIGTSTDFEKVEGGEVGGRYLEEIQILNSFSFEDKVAVCHKAVRHSPCTSSLLLLLHIEYNFPFLF